MEAEAEAEAEKNFWMEAEAEAEAKKNLVMEAEAEAVQKFGASTSLIAGFAIYSLLSRKLFFLQLCSATLDEALETLELWFGD